MMTDYVAEVIARVVVGCQAMRIPYNIYISVSENVNSDKDDVQ